MLSLAPPLFVVLLLWNAAIINAQTGSTASCGGCATGWCCSKWGYCGTTSAYCAPDNCVGGACWDSSTETFSTPTPTTPAPTTTPEPGSCAAGCAPGLCCSPWGFCGSGPAYCGSGTSAPTTSPTSPTPPTTSSPTTASPTTQPSSTSTPTTSVPTTSGPTTTPTPTTGPIKAIYIDWQYNNSDAATSVTGAVDAGFNLIILAFYLSSGPADMALAWGQLSQAAQTSAISYAHGKGASVIVSWGGSTQGSFDSLDASTQGSTVANWALQNNLDGVDFDLEGFGNYFTYGSMSTTQTVQWVADITNSARSTLGTSKIITHAPVAPYFGATYSYGYEKVYSMALSINYFLVQFYNQGSTCYTTYTGLFQDSSSDCVGGYQDGTSISEIASYNINGYQVPLSKLVVGKPVLNGDQTNGGYVDASSLHSFFVEASSNIGWNTGVMGWMWHDSQSSADSSWIATIYP